jgi:Uma2 family endonuclease
MGVPQTKPEMMTEEDYLSYERQAKQRNEFYNGECFAMAGASRWHNILSGRIFSALFRHLDGKSCTPYMADMRLYLETHQHYVYPDVLVVCEEKAYIADDMVNDASVIIEVLSPSTELYDRGRKFLHYQSLPSLQEYVLFSQEVMQVEIFHRRERYKWEYERLNQPDDMLFIEILQFSITLAELYKNIPLAQENV